MPASKPLHRRAWLVAAIALQGWPLFGALRSMWTIATQWTEWFFVLGTTLGTLRLLLNVAAVLVFGAAIIGLSRRQAWGWTAAVVGNLAGVALTLYSAILAHLPRPNFVSPALYVLSLSVLFFAPLGDRFVEPRSPVRVPAWWDGEPGFDRRMAKWIAIGQAAICSYALLGIAVSPYPASKAIVVLAILGLGAGLFVVKAGSVPAYAMVILWYSAVLALVVRFRTGQLARHHSAAMPWPFVAGCIAAALCVAIALGHEIWWRARSRGVTSPIPETPSATEPAEVVSVATPLTESDRRERLARARITVLRQSQLSMALIVPFVLVQVALTTGARESNWIGHFLAPAALLIAVIGMELPFVLVLARLRHGVDPIAGAIAAGAAVLWLGLLGLGALAAILPLGPYGIPWAAFLLQPWGIVAVLWIVLFVRAQRALVREGDVLHSGTGEDGSLAAASSARVLPLGLFLGAVVVGAILHQVGRSFTEREDARRRDAYVRAHPPKPLPPPLPKLTQLWQTQLFAPTHFSGPVTPAVAPDGSIIVAADSELVAVAANGAVLWRNETIHAAAQTPAIDASGTIYVAGRGDSLYAIARGGRRRWAIHIGQDRPVRYERLVPPAASGSAVYARARDGSVVRVSADGHIAWRAPVQQTITAAAVHSDGSISVVESIGAGYSTCANLIRIDARARIVSRIGMQCGSVSAAPPAVDRNDDTYIIDAADLLRVTAKGVLRRVAPGGPIVDGTAAIAPGSPERIIVTTAGETSSIVSSLSPDGVLQWTTTLRSRTGAGESIVGAVAPESDGRRVVVSTNRRVVVIGTADGTQIAEFEFEPLVYAAHGGYQPTSASGPVIGPDGVIYVVDTGVRLHALRERSFGFVRRRGSRRRRMVGAAILVGAAIAVALGSRAVSWT